MRSPLYSRLGNSWIFVGKAAMEAYGANDHLRRCSANHVGVDQSHCCRDLAPVAFRIARFWVHRFSQALLDIHGCVGHSVSVIIADYSSRSGYRELQMDSDHSGGGYGKPRSMVRLCVANTQCGYDSDGIYTFRTAGGAQQLSKLYSE